MGWRAVVAVLVPLTLSCGGSSRAGSSTSGGAGAAAAQGGAGESGAAGGASGGAAAGRGGAVTVGGAGGASVMGSAGETQSGNPSAGGGSSAGSPGNVFGRLSGGTFVYSPDRQWQGTGGTPADELDEADYEPFEGESMEAFISYELSDIRLTLADGVETLRGTRDASRTDRAWFDLVGYAGGRFVVKMGETSFEGEHTMYGSGVPVVSSTRGTLRRLP